MAPVVISCELGGAKSGVPAPLNRVFLPTGAAVVHDGRWLLVVNSNSDLRYSTGTVVPLDLAAAAKDRANAASWPVCPTVDFRPKKYDGKQVCCRDLLDPRVLNCDDRPYADASATVRIGSFGTAPVLQAFERDGQKVGRLFFAVRSDPSITFVDVTESAGRPKLTCTGTAGVPSSAESNPQCSGDFKVEEGVVEGQTMPLPEEPFDLTLDADRIGPDGTPTPGLGVLYVGHLLGGISILNVCGAQMGVPPRLSGVLPFPYGSQPSGGVTATVPSKLGDPGTPIFTTARNGINIGRLFFRDPTVFARPCSALDQRDLTLVAAAPTAATAFLPKGGDTRGLVYQAEEGRAFVLHRNTGSNPAALTRVRLVTDAVGLPQFAPSESIDVCAGPSHLQLHDAGRGPRLFVTCFDAGQLYEIDPDLMVVTDAIDVGRGPSMLIFDPGNPEVAYVSGFVDNNISVLDLRPGSSTESRVVQRIGFPRTSTQL